MLNDILRPLVRHSPSELLNGYNRLSNNFLIEPITSQTAAASHSLPIRGCKTVVSAREKQAQRPTASPVPLLELGDSTI